MRNAVTNSDGYWDTYTHSNGCAQGHPDATAAADPAATPIAVSRKHFCGNSRANLVSSMREVDRLLRRRRPSPKVQECQRVEDNAFHLGISYVGGSASPEDNDFSERLEPPPYLDRHSGRGTTRSTLQH
jgi:hypothetical protein